MDSSVSSMISPMISTAWSNHRNASLSILERLPLPDSKNERWRYTQGRDFLLDQPHVPLAYDPQPRDPPPRLLPAGSSDVLTISQGLLSDSSFHQEIKRLTDLGCETLEEALLHHSRETVHLLDRSRIKDEYFVHWNTVRCTQGLVIRVPRSRPAQPLELLWSHRQSPSLFRLVLIVGSGARLQLIEQESSQRDTLRHIVREIFLEQGAELDHVLLDDVDDDGGRWLWTTGVHLDEGASYRGIALHTGARKARHDWHVFLEGRGAHSQLHAVSMLGPDRVCDLETDVRHRGDGTISRQLVHISATARAHGIYGGSVTIAQRTKGVDAQQQIRGLQLDRAANIDARPELHIHSDDVRATHGASIGEIDPLSLFYLRSRGLDEWYSRALLLDAFSQRVLTEMDGSLPTVTAEALSMRLRAISLRLVPERTS